MADTTTPTFYERLATVQVALKAPKSSYNKFASFYYRSAEDILEAVKPLLAENGLTLHLSDSLTQIGSRYYVMAEARLTAHDGNGSTETTAYAREDEDKKGMDGSQITGTASSYARKYALNGLFLIDDTKDADTDEHHAQTAQQPRTTPTTTTPSPPATSAPVRPAAPAKSPQQGQSADTTEDAYCELDDRLVKGKDAYWSRRKCDGHVFCYTHRQQYEAGDLHDSDGAPAPKTIDEELNNYIG